MNPVYVIFLGLFSVYIGQSILAPVLPPLVRELGLTELQGGLIMTFSSIMWVIFSPMWGRRSEVWGRKPVFLLALIGYAVGVGAFGLVMQLGLDQVIVPSLLVWLLLVGTRMIVGTVFSGAPPAAQAYVADTTTGADRTTAIGVISAASGVGTILGPALGAAVVGFGLVAPIFLSALLPLAGVLVVALLLPAAAPRMKRGQPLAQIRARDTRLWPILLIGTAITTTMSLVQFTIAFYFQDRLQLTGPETAQAVGTALMASGVAALFAQFVLLRVLRWSSLSLLHLGLPLTLISLLLLLVSSNFGLLALALIVNGLGTGLAVPSFRSAITFAVEPHEQGAAAGLTSGVTGLGYVFGPALGTGLYAVNLLLPYLFGIAVLVGGMALLVIHPRTRVVRPQSVLS
ncbi:MAG: MFS transporter [Anaerolineae bacterium]|nr:MFS transporter [Anaerolineae bacterium]